MTLSITADLGYHLPDEHEVLLAVRVADRPEVRLVGEELTIAGGSAPRPVADASGRRDWSRGRGLFEVHYSAQVEITREFVNLGALDCDALPDLPADVLPSLNPSRYCESDRLEGVVDRRFPVDTHGRGGRRIGAMADWIRSSFRYAPSGSASLTTAADSLLTRTGVCRDYAHSLIALARAAGVPARMLSVYAPDVDPPDFHAVAEVWLAGGWHIVDPTGMATVQSIVPIANGLDAAEVSFMAIWGTAQFRHQSVRVERT